MHWSIRFLLISIPVIFLSFGVAFYTSDLPAEDVKADYSLFDSKFVNIDGHEIHYRRKGIGKTLVMVHGFGGNLRNWTEWYDILGDHLDVVCLDLPGYGLTGAAPGIDYSDSAQVEFLDRFLTVLEIDSFCLAGNSMGGAIAWKFALEHPNRVEKLLLLNSAGYLDQDKKELVLGFKMLKNPLFKHVVSKITPRFVVKKSLQRIFVDPELFDDKETDMYMALMRREGNRKVLVERINESFWDQSDRIREIQQPTLIIWGQHDVVIDVKFAEYFARDIQNSKLIVYDDAGHIPMKEIPERSASDALAFIENIPIRGSH